MNRRTLLAAAAALAMFRPRPARAADSAYWESIVRDAAHRYAINADWLVTVAMCESELNPAVVGNPNPDGSGPDTGLFQFSPATWEEMCGYMGIVADIWDGHSQAEVAAWAHAAGYACRWKCNRCGNL